MLTFCLLRSGSSLYSISMTFCKSLILLLIFYWPISPRTPLFQVVIPLSWAFPAFLSLTLASLTLCFSHIAWACLMSSHVEPFFISFAAWFPFYREGIFPRVSISYTCILALRIGMFHCLELVCLPLWQSSPGIILGVNFIPVGYFCMFFSKKRFTILHFLKPCFAQFFYGVKNFHPKNHQIII